MQLYLQGSVASYLFDHNEFLNEFIVRNKPLIQLKHLLDDIG